MSSSNGRHTAPAEFPPPIDTQAEIVRRRARRRGRAHRGRRGDRRRRPPPACRAPTGSCSCWPTTRRRSSGWARSRSRSSRRRRPAAGTTCSGAVMRPGPLQELFPDLSREDWRKGASRTARSRGRGGATAAFVKKRSVRVPTPPNFKNHGNEVVSVAGLDRWPARNAEEAGAYILTETAATKLLVTDGECSGVRSGDKGRGKEGQELGNFEPGSDVIAQATVLAEGCWGHLTGAAHPRVRPRRGRRAADLGARRQGGLEGPEALNKRDPHAGAMAAEALRRSTASTGGSWIYPIKDEKNGDDLVSIGFVCDLRLQRRDDLGPRPAPAVQDPPARARDPRGRRAGGLGREGDAGAAATGRCPSSRCPARCWSATRPEWSTRSP